MELSHVNRFEKCSNRRTWGTRISEAASFIASAHFIEYFNSCASGSFVFGGEGVGLVI
jgi:hypothetical protein